MTYDSLLLSRMADVAGAIDVERCTSLILETYEYCTAHERYADAALVVMIGCRRLQPIDVRHSLLATLADRHTWSGVLGVPFFRAWLEQPRNDTARAPRLQMEERERRSVEVEDDDDLLSICRRVFATIGHESEGPGGDGMNLIFFLNRSRRRWGSSRLFNPACFGLQHVNGGSDEELNSILGHMVRGEIRVLDIQLGTSPPGASEE